MSKPPVSGNRTGRKLGQKVKKGKLKASSRRWRLRRRRPCGFWRRD